MGVSGQFHVESALRPGKNPLYPLDRRFGGPQNRSGRSCEEENNLLLLEIEPLSFNPQASHYTELF